MKTEREYSFDDLIEGICPSCGERTDCIYAYDENGRCIDCIEEEIFIEECEKTIKKHRL